MFCLCGVERGEETEPPSISAGGSPTHVSTAPSATPGLYQAKFTMKNVLSTDAVLFRIQTTSPLSYRVRPSHGRIEPGETQEVHIVMMSESKKNDKFLVNFAATTEPANSALDFAAQFAAVDGVSQKNRMRCVFPSSFGLLAASGSGGPISPVVPSLVSASVDDAMLHLETASNSPVAASERLTESKEQLKESKELKEARARIEQLTALNAELVASIEKKGKALPQEWSALLKGQYGAPPVLVLLVAVFAFLIGLLF